MEAYSMDLRKRVLAACDAGLGTKQVATWFRVSRSWVRRLKQRRREWGRIERLPPNSGRKRKLSDDDLDRLKALVAEQPDATLKELRERLAVEVDVSTICRALQKLRLSVKKKTLHAAEQNRPDVREQREAWPDRFLGIDPDRLVFLDESGARTNMTRLRGRSLVGERLVAYVPHGHWKTNTIISAIGLRGAFATAVFDSPTDTDVFGAYVEQVLCQELRPDDIVVMDNLRPHKAAGIRESIESVGASVVYLPPYSPDFNPIEEMWSKLKEHLRSAGSRTFDTLCQAVATGLGKVSRSDCIGFFTDCRYAT